MIDSLDHLQLAMPPGQEENARAFFRDLLGMTEDPKPEPLASRGGLLVSIGKGVPSSRCGKGFHSSEEGAPGVLRIEPH